MLGGEKSPMIYKDFQKMLEENVTKVKEINGAGDIFRWLKNKDMKVAVESGFPATVTRDIIKHLRWIEDGLVDYWTCSEIVEEERPSAAMIRRIMRHLHTHDPSEVVKVDDTVIGIEEGHNAKTFTIAVLTGTQSREKLESAKPDAILESIRELPVWLEERHLV